MSCDSIRSDTCHLTEVCGIVQTSSEGTPISTTFTILYGGSSIGLNSSVSAIGLFGNLSAVATITVSLLLGGSSGAEVARYVLGPLETRSFTFIGFDTIVASATVAAQLSYTIQIRTRQ